MREFSITNDHLKTVIPAKAGTQVCLSDEMGLSATNLAGGGFRKHAAATHFLCSAKESKQRKGDPLSWQMRSPVRFALGFP
jgi:hypothetical protein